MNLTQSTNSGVAISAFGTARSTLKGAPLSSDELHKIDAYWRAYACETEQDVQLIVAQRTDVTELQVVENIQRYYLVPGTVVQVIKEDPAKGISQIRVLERFV